MSSGNVHRKASLLLASGFSVGALISQNPDMLLCTVGAITGIIISPDLDVDAGNISNKIIRNKIGWFAERIWSVFWSGYGKSFKHGRFASHFPVFSTTVRVLYAYFWLIFIPHFLIWLLIPVSWELMFVLSWYAKIFWNFWFFYGLASSDLIHQALDVLTKESK